MHKSVSIFAIIVTYKGQQWYDRCFTSLRNSSIPVQTIVVDNASDDGTVEYIHENFPEIHLIESKENLGFGRANNLAMRYALDNGCDYVFLLNQDAWLDDSDTLKNLVEIYERHPEYGILSPMHLNINKNGLIMECFCRRPDNQKLIEDLYLNQVTDIYTTKYIHAAAWMLSRNTLEKVGGFNPIFYHYEEDGEYLNRVDYYNLKIGVCPSARIVHDHNDKPMSKEKYLLRHNQMNLVDYLDMHKPFNYSSIIRYYVRKWIIFALKRKKHNAFMYKQDIKFLMSKKHEILEIRKQCETKCPMWL